MKAVWFSLGAPVLLAGCASTPHGKKLAETGKNASKKECRVIRSTGTIMPKYVCMARERWQQIDSGNAAAAQQGLDDMHRSAEAPPRR